MPKNFMMAKQLQIMVEELHDGKTIANYGRVIVRGNNVLFIKLENEL